MNTIRSINSIILLISIAFTSCNRNVENNSPTWSELPEVTTLNKLPQTDFALTLENPISENKNTIYAPAFLFAWDEVKEKLNATIIENDTNSLDFKLINRSISHLNTLAKNEYTASASIVYGIIRAKAFFNKTLPFEYKLQVLDNSIVFNSTKVAAFGMDYFDEKIIPLTEILYYKNDDHFILKLSPKDKQHEIILVKGIDTPKTFIQAITQTNQLIEEGKTEKEKENKARNYIIQRDDIFAIPTIKFNIETNFKNLERQNFLTNNKIKHSIEVAYQRTGFILNENGAVVESEATVAVDSASTIPTVSYPKKMIFDKPFYIFIKRTDNKNPYFAMKVSNTELLEKK